MSEQSPPLTTPRKLGPFLATMFVTGNIVGSGLFLLPATLAGIGGISVISWGLATLGALVIALAFARLGVLAPWAGGSFAHAHALLGRYLGFQANYLYWLATWIGNVAIALAVTGYLGELLPALQAPWNAALVTVVVLWLAVLVNIIGPRAVGRLETAALVLGLAPVLVLAAVGWGWFDPAVFRASWNVSGQTPVHAVTASLVLVFWAFLGLETAAVAAAVIERPERNLPIAVLAGVIIAALVYASSCTVLLGIVPARTLAQSSAPFALLAARLFGPAVAALLSITAIIKAAGTLSGWVLVLASTSRAAADAGSFPALFARVDRRGIPVRNLIVHGLLMSVAALVTVSPTLAQQFNRLVDVTVVFTLIIYAFSALALFRLAPGPGGRPLQDRLIALLALAFSVWVVLASDLTLLLVALAIVATSVPVYGLYRSRRDRISAG